MSKILSILFILITSFTAAQSRLNVGDEIENLVIKNIVNYGKPSMRLSDFSGKAIIIDFWATTCGACVETMPKMASLQKKYRENLQFFYATWQSLGLIDSFFNKYPDIKKLNMPIITGANTLRQFFPYETLPHVVWIGKDRKIKAITEGVEVTESNIERFIRSGSIHLPQKKDLMSYDYHQPFFNSNVIEPQQLLYNSVLTKYADGLWVGRSGMHYMKDGRFRFFALNKPLLFLFQEAYADEINIQHSNDLATKIVLNVKEKSVFMLPTSASGSQDIRDKSFCYELIIPEVVNSSLKMDQKRIRLYMRSDLDRYFNIQTNVEIRQRPCYVIRIAKKNATTTDSSIYISHPDFVEFENEPISWVVSDLKKYFPFDKPVIISGDDSTKVTINIKKNYSNIAKMKQDLSSQGFSVTEMVSAIKVLVISEK